MNNPKDQLLHKIIKYGYKYGTTKSNNYKERFDNYVDQYDNLIGGKLVCGYFNFDKYIKDDKFDYIKKIKSYKSVINNIKKFIMEFEDCNQNRIKYKLKIDFLENIIQKLINMKLPIDEPQMTAIDFLNNFLSKKNYLTNYLTNYPSNDTNELRSFVYVLYYNQKKFIEIFEKDISKSDLNYVKNFNIKLCETLDRFIYNNYLIFIYEEIDYSYLITSADIEYIATYAKQILDKSHFSKQLINCSIETHEKQLNESPSDKYIESHIEPHFEILKSFVPITILPSVGQIIDCIVILMTQIKIELVSSRPKPIDDIIMSEYQSRINNENEVYRLVPILYIAIIIMIDDYQKLAEFYGKDSNEFKTSLKTCSEHIINNYTKYYNYHHNKKQ